MKKDHSFGFAVFILLLLAVIAIAPVSAVTVGSSAAETIISTPVATPTAPKAFVSATVSSVSPTVGDPVTISGTATGGNVSAGVQIWVFAGNYVNVTTVPANSDGSFSKTYSSAGLPPATYYVFVQDPGPAGIFDIDLQDTGIFSGQVVNTRTGALIFNFTGSGSVHDAEAAQKLSDAINTQGNDDVYTKLTFQLTAPASVPTTQSPMPLWISLTALAVGGLFVAQFVRKN